MHGLAAIQYEIVLAGNWNNKYAGSLKEVAQEEYAHMMRDAIRRKAVSNKLIDVFGERLEGFDCQESAGRSARDHFLEHRQDRRRPVGHRTGRREVLLRPSKDEQRRRTDAGHRQRLRPGTLPDDQGQEGRVRIIVHFFSGPRNTQVVEGTHVNVVVRRNAGTPQEVSQRTTVILRRQNDQVEVANMKFE